MNRKTCRQQYPKLHKYQKQQKRIAAIREQKDGNVPSWKQQLIALKPLVSIE